MPLVVWHVPEPAVVKKDRARRPHRARLVGPRLVQRLRPRHGGVERLAVPKRGDVDHGVLVRAGDVRRACLVEWPITMPNSAARPSAGHPAEAGGVGVGWGGVGAPLLPLAAGVVRLAGAEGNLRARSEQRRDQVHHGVRRKPRREGLVEAAQPRHVADGLRRAGVPLLRRRAQDGVAHTAHVGLRDDARQQAPTLRGQLAQLPLHQGRHGPDCAPVGGSLPLRIA